MAQITHSCNKYVINMRINQANVIAPSDVLVKEKKNGRWKSSTQKEQQGVNNLLVLVWSSDGWPKNFLGCLNKVI